MVLQAVKRGGMIVSKDKIYLVGAATYKGIKNDEKGNNTEVEVEE
jgi:hypothetical protein